MSKNRGLKSGADLIGQRGQRVNSIREITMSYEGRDEIVVVKPPNLSRGGMFINTSESFPEGAILNLRFELLHTGAQIETRCEVRYRQPRIGVGVEFIGLSEEAARAIEQEIVRHQEGAIQERPRRRRTKGAAPICGTGRT
jgi:Tfp pilus assembly protein PilZ